METFNKDKLIEDFYIIQILLQNLNYNDGKKRGQFYKDQFKYTIALLQQQNYRIEKNQNNTSSNISLNILPTLDFVVVNQEGKIIMPSNQVEPKVDKIVRFGEDYVIDSFTN